MDVETKRLEAKGYVGVSYDTRSDRFTAEIWVTGERRWLGSYHTAQEASDAYETAKAARPPREQRPNAFMEAYRAFRDRHGGDRADPPEGAELVYDGQAFTFAGTTWRHVKGQGRFVFMLWRSRCKTCGGEYSTMTPSPVSVAKGVTRNCPEHVGKSRFGPRKAASPVKAAPAVELTMYGELEQHLKALGLTHQRLPIGRVAELLAGRGFSRRTLHSADALRNVLGRWIAKDVKGQTEAGCPVELEGDVIVFPFNPALGLL